MNEPALAPGDEVRLKGDVNYPWWGWGDVNWGDVGTLLHIHEEGNCSVSFSTHRGGFPSWRGNICDLELAPNHQMHQGLVDMNQRLFSSRSAGDVVIELANGTEHAHKNVMMAASDVFSAMFMPTTLEGQTNLLKLADVEITPMRVFLRLLYTNLVDPLDWSGISSSRNMPAKVLFEVIGMARKYMVVHVQEAAMEALKLRLYRAATKGDLSNFEDLWRTSIAEGIDAIRIKALQMVSETYEFEDEDDDQDWDRWWKDSNLGDAIKDKYDENALCPEVMFELQTLWPPATRAAKYRRMF
mmetsp:Transcript_99465/g.176484  ORF Transcript_99465/g.176484 Transcript_99465/m.176484 type:complete len:299 (+) Transcript_99465:94-990(+)